MPPHTDRPSRLTPILTLRERNDVIRIDQGTLIITSEEYYACGSTRMTVLRVTMKDEIALERHRWMNFPIDADERDTLRTDTSATLARQLRIMAMPLIVRPGSGLELGVDVMMRMANEHLPEAPRRLN